MSRQLTRIMTTHTGSLPRPTQLTGRLRELDRDGPDPADPASLATEVRQAVGQVVTRQVETGIDIINDGEQGKAGFSIYVQDRMTGFGGEGSWEPLADIADFPNFAHRYAEWSGSVDGFGKPACIGPVSYCGYGALQRDLDNLRVALTACGRHPSGAFLSAASPGIIALSLSNQYYPTEDEYLAAVADAMREEYRRIIDAGFMLQVDCPDLAMARHTRFAGESVQVFRRWAASHIEALNHALAGLSVERLRMHVCWGNYEGPHHRDVPLHEIVDLLLAASPAGLSFEAANPRHAHEWRVWEDAPLPDGKILIPGVLDTTTNYVEHPELVAERISRFVDIVGPERVIAGTDCGLSTFAGYEIVDPEIAWAKLASLVAGAQIASLQRR